MLSKRLAKSAIPPARKGEGGISKETVSWDQKVKLKLYLQEEVSLCKRLSTKIQGSSYSFSLSILKFGWYRHGSPKASNIRTTFYHGLPSQTFSAIRDLIIQTSCAEPHSEFLQKCSHPLWKNPEFFISLPSKRNEDVNPTKASHQGMTPEHQQLALPELHQLHSEGLIEPTCSPWECAAFYDNKWIEQIRGKLSLVNNYQHLNHFLQDDKFPLPRRDVL